MFNDLKRHFKRVEWPIMQVTISPHVPLSIKAESGRDTFACVCSFAHGTATKFCTGRSLLYAYKGVFSYWKAKSFVRHSQTRAFIIFL